MTGERVVVRVSLEIDSEASWFPAGLVSDVDHETDTIATYQCWISSGQPFAIPKTARIVSARLVLREPLPESKAVPECALPSDLSMLTLQQLWDIPYANLTWREKAALSGHVAICHVRGEPDPEAAYGIATMAARCGRIALGERIDETLPSDYAHVIVARTNRARAAELGEEAGRAAGRPDVDPRFVFDEARAAAHFANIVLREEASAGDSAVAR